MAAKGKRSMVNEHIREMNERKTLADEQKRLDKMCSGKGASNVRGRLLREMLVLDTEGYAYA